jgi:hypothetical protein
MKTNQLNLPAARSVCLTLLVMLAVPAAGQRDESQSFRARDGYEEASFGSQEVAIKTARGEKKVRVSLSKLRVAQQGKQVAVKWPGAGLLLLQHGAGEITVTSGKEKFEALEGEWMRFVLPADVSLSTGDDSALLDLILIEEVGH